IGEAVVAAGEPGILVNHAAEPVAEFVVGALPEGAECAGGGNDRVVVNAILGADLRDAIRHASAASDAVDETARAFEHAMQDALRRRHLPQHVHVEPALAVGALVGNLRLMDAAGDGVADQLLVALAARLAIVDLRLAPALLVEAVGIDAREGADAA